MDEETPYSMKTGYDLTSDAYDSCSLSDRHKCLTS